MKFIDYYDILQVSPNAHLEVIKSSYRTLMSKLNMHPDKGGDEEKAKLINLAYEVLSNEKLRADYDLHYEKHFSTKKNNSNEPKNENENYVPYDTAWKKTPLSDKEMNELAVERLNKLFEFDKFKNELKDFIKKNRG